MSNKPDIREIGYHYSRQQRGQTVTGRVDVRQVYQEPGTGRWRVLGIDRATKRDITLWPKDIGKPVRVR